MTKEGVILYDGECPLCAYSMTIIRRRDRKKIFRFVPLGSDEGRQLLNEYALQQSDLNSVVLIEGGIPYLRSTAALRIAKHLEVLSVLYVLYLLPETFRDSVYDWIARNRYRWFGRSDDETVS